MRSIDAPGDGGSGHAATPHGITSSMTLLLAFACGALAANLYYSQPLIALISPDIGLSAKAASLVVTLTQIGYATGLLFLVPLGDLVENRRLILTALCGTLAAIAVAALVPNAALFLTAALLIGITSSACQMVMPIAAHMATDASRGRVVGNVMSGLLVGILFARPVASLIAGSFGWRGVYGFSILLMLLLGGLLWRFLPERRPHGGMSYGGLLASLWTILRDNPVLLRRSIYQMALFATFSLFWTAVPLELASPQFGLTQHGIALFALAGAAGAFAAPFAGRAADRGWSRGGTAVSIGLVFLGFALGLAGFYYAQSPFGLAALVAAGVVIDSGVQGNMLFGQKAIYSLSPAIRSRVNGIYIAIFFVGGAIGSAVASPTFETGGWTAICYVGMAFPTLGFLYYLTEFLPGRRKAG